MCLMCMCLYMCIMNVWCSPAVVIYVSYVHVLIHVYIYIYIILYASLKHRSLYTDSERICIEVTCVCAHALVCMYVCMSVCTEACVFVGLRDKKKKGDYIHMVRVSNNQLKRHSESKSFRPEKLAIGCKGFQNRMYVCIYACMHAWTWNKACKKSNGHCAACRPLRIRMQMMAFTYVCKSW